MRQTVKDTTYILPITATCVHNLSVVTIRLHTEVQKKECARNFHVKDFVFLIPCTA